MRTGAATFSSAVVPLRADSRTRARDVDGSTHNRRPNETKQITTLTGAGAVLKFLVKQLCCSPWIRAVSR